MYSWGTSSVMDLSSLAVGPSHIRQPLSDGPAEGRDVLACAPATFVHGSALLNQSHLEAFSAASVVADGCSPTHSGDAKCSVGPAQRLTGKEEKI